MRLIIVRGVSGSGKSTFAKKCFNKLSQIYENKVFHFETDDYFIDTEGNYKFIAENLHKYHKMNQERTFDALNNKNIVIVSNTFTRIKEIEPYVSYALNNGHDVQIYEATGKFKNSHGVSDEHIQRMKNRFASQNDVEKFFENKINYFKVNQDV